MISPERKREISAQGGRAAHAQGKAHEFKKGSELAREAGRKGGRAIAAKKAAEKREKVRVLCKEGAETFRKTPLSVTNATMGGCKQCGRIDGIHALGCSVPYEVTQETVENTTLAELPSAELE